MDTDSSFPDTPRYGTEELEGTWPQQTFCQGSDNLQPADCVLLPVQGGYRFGNQARGHPTLLYRFVSAFAEGNHRDEP